MYIIILLLIILLCGGVGYFLYNYNKDTKKQIGETCTKDSNCINNNCFKGTCFKKLPNGAKCNAQVQCITNSCFNGTCTNKFGIGNDCEMHSNCKSNVCHINIKKCALKTGKFPKNGPCKNNDDCVNNRCINGKCQDPQVSGKPCNTDNHCKSNKCIRINGYNGSKFCTDIDGKLPIDTPCEKHEECQSGRCSSLLQYHNGVYGKCIKKSQYGQECISNSDCEYNCNWNRCMEEDGKLSVGMQCHNKDHCRTGMCQGTNDISKHTNNTEPICINKFPNDHKCDRYWQCASGECSNGVCFSGFL